jgi:hypothetical protein
MKKLIYSLFIIVCSSTILYGADNCDGALAKLKPSCNFVGKGVEKMKDFSKNNKTIGQSLENVGVIKKKETDKPKKTLKQIAKENKTIDQTIRNMENKK